MKHELYIFGSIIRGEVSLTSDVDVLVIPTEDLIEYDYPRSWSVYPLETLRRYYSEGRLFAWHLHMESKCIFSPFEKNRLAQLGEPAQYTTEKQDVDELHLIMKDSLDELRKGTDSSIFEIGIIHTVLRDIAMSASWQITGSPCFSRESPYNLPINFPLTKDTYNAAMLARHCSTRGINVSIDTDAISKQLLSSPLNAWVEEVRSYL